MNITCISEMEAGSHWAHAINLVKTAGGFSRLGHDVTVLCRSPTVEMTQADLNASYGEPALQWRFAPIESDESGDAVSQRFAEWALGQAKELGADGAYIRHYHAPLEFCQAGIPTAMETHAYVGYEQAVLDQCFSATTKSDHPLQAVITISGRLMKHYIARGAAAGCIHIVPDGVDVDLFAQPELLPSAPYPENGRPRIVYAGHLYDSKGIPTMLDAAAEASELDFHLIGGAPEDIARTMQRAGELGLSNVYLHGLVSHAQVPEYLWHADVLVLPPGAKDPSAQWTSPVKLGEYLASGTPIVCSDIPGLRDWLGERDVFWFAPDDAYALRTAIQAALEEPEEDRARRRVQSFELAEAYSYVNRARRILAAVGLNEELATATTDAGSRRQRA